MYIYAFYSKYCIRFLTMPQLLNFIFHTPRCTERQLLFVWVSCVTGEDISQFFRTYMDALMRQKAAGARWFHLHTQASITISCCGWAFDKFKRADVRKWCYQEAHTWDKLRLRWNDPAQQVTIGQWEISCQNKSVCSLHAFRCLHALGCFPGYFFCFFVWT